MALLTNGSAAIQRRRIEKHALATYFDYILIEGEFGIGKPDRRVYLHANSHLDAREPFGKDDVELVRRRRRRGWSRRL